MLAVVATLYVRDGKQAEFEELLRGLAAQVEANEAGCKLYQLCRSKTPGTYVLIERYEDQQAFQTHTSTDYFKAAAGRMGPCFAKPPQIEILEEIGLGNNSLS